MEDLTFDKAYYIKLGRGGIWEQSSINESKMRIGWSLQDVEDLEAGRFKELQTHMSKKSLNQLRWISESTDQDVWVTFSSSKMWWCRVASPEVFSDQVSRYREVDGWSDADIHGNVLQINRVPGVHSKIQGYRGTACRVWAKATLRRLLNDEPSPQYQDIDIARRNLINSVKDGIKGLHWKDYELFVDLLFRESGWRRLSMLGETMKYADLELEDPITHDKYQVQIKSRANLADFKEYSSQFSGRGYRKLYFVVHTPDGELAASLPDAPEIEFDLARATFRNGCRIGPG